MDYEADYQYVVVVAMQSGIATYGPADHDKCVQAAASMRVTYPTATVTVSPLEPLGEPGA